MRRHLFRLIVVVLALASASIASARTAKILLPLVVPQPLPGAFGSLWVTHTTVLNVGTTPVQVGGLGQSCPFDPCVMPALPPQSTIEILPYVGAGIPGRFLIVDSADEPSLRVQLRVLDVSRLTEAWGTEVPVVGEESATTRPIELLSVPSDARFRPLLRIYDFDSAPEHSALVRVYRPNSGGPDTLLSATTVALQVSPAIGEYPGYAQMAIETGEESDVRVEVVPVDAAFRAWAFVSVTNNNTQQVTVVTPQPLN